MNSSVFVKAASMVISMVIYVLLLIPEKMTDIFLPVGKMYSLD